MSVTLKKLKVIPESYYPKFSIELQQTTGSNPEGVEKWSFEKNAFTISIKILKFVAIIYISFKVFSPLCKSVL